MDPEELQARIKTLPPSITSWFESDTVLNNTAAIIKHFNITDKDIYVIPTLLLGLQIKDLDPKYFAGELAYELKLERDRAMMITDEINRLILYPIKKELLDMGVGISGLSHFEMPVLSKAALAPAVVEEIKGSGGTAIDLSKKEIPLDEKGEPLTPFDASAISRITFKIDSLGNGEAAKSAKVTSNEPAPVIIHEEQTGKPISSFPSFDLKFSKNKLNEVEEKRAPLKPAELEVRGLKKEEQKTAPSPLPKIPTEIKIVHYDQFKPSGGQGSEMPAPISSLPLETRDKRASFWGQFKNAFSASGTGPSGIAAEKDAMPPAPGQMTVPDAQPLRYPIPPKVGSEVPPVPISGYKKISFSAPAGKTEPKVSLGVNVSDKKEEKRFSPAQLESKADSATVRVVDFNEKGNEVSASTISDLKSKAQAAPVPPLIPGAGFSAGSSAKSTEIVKIMDLERPKMDKTSVQDKIGQSPSNSVQKKNWLSFFNFFSKKESGSEVKPVTIFPPAPKATIDSSNANSKKAENVSGSAPIPGPIIIPPISSSPSPEKKDGVSKKFPIPPKIGVGK